MSAQQMMLTKEDIDEHLRRGNLLVWQIASAIRYRCPYIPFDNAESIALKTAKFAVEVERPFRPRR